MTDTTDRASEDQDEQQQTDSRGKSHPSTEMGTHLADSQRESGGVPRGGVDSPNDVSRQEGEIEER